MNTVAWLGNINAQELMVILLIVVLLFGAKKLPELARSIGQSMKEFRKGREQAEKEEEDTERAATSQVKDKAKDDDAPKA